MSVEIKQEREESMETLQAIRRRSEVFRDTAEGLQFYIDIQDLRIN